MPYITKNLREIWEPQLGELKKSMFGMSKGELTYLNYSLALEFIKKKGKDYQNISDAIAALNDAAAELRRRILNPYEDKKIKQNGDIK